MVRKFLIFLVCIVLSGCSITQSMEDIAEGAYTDSLAQSDDIATRIGKNEHPAVVAKYGGEYRNKKVEDLLAIILGRLVAVSDDKALIYNATILDTPKVNAFALPGGYIYITRGLLALANDTAELAAVLAHEMAHVTANHAIMRKDKESANSVADDLVSSNVLSNDTASKIALAANRLRLAEFSKEQELQADAIGIRMLGAAGYDAHGAARFLETMQAYSGLVNGGSSRLADEAFVSSHPSTPQRIQLARQHARFYGAPGTGEADRIRYLDGIDGMLFGDAADEGFVRGNGFFHPALKITFEVPAGVTIENQPTAVVADGPENIATRFDAAIFPSRLTMADYMKSGWVKGLEEGSIEELTINGMPAVYARASGGKWLFDLYAIRSGDQVYRFITAGPRNDVVRDQVRSQTARRIAGSFRKMSDAELKRVSALKIRIYTVKENDTLATLAERMVVSGSPLRMLQVYNGLSAGRIPEQGTIIKTITDE